MISDLDHHQGAVIRQLIVAAAKPLSIGPIITSGRIDSFRIDRGAFQIKHSSKRLSPWQFTYLAENLRELEQLEKQYTPVWAILVCGFDGIVGLSLEELRSITRINDQGNAWIRVRRSKKGMYRVSGSECELDKAKPKGMDAFVSKISGLDQREGGK